MCGDCNPHRPAAAQGFPTLIAYLGHKTSGVLLCGAAISPIQQHIPASQVSMHDAHAVQPAEGLSHLAGSAEDALHAGAPLKVGGLRQEPALVHARLQGGAREKGNQVWPGEEHN